ncbi:glycosyltransferase family 2 protein [Brachyspira pilosicoli]|uniref:glycosyltransferase family 2 protein n=1 Tax=Brachyspira pilosicoli TaxID=52584 RepID=UPI0012F4CDC0|nr:glycosyltransferase family 2 protein [Brachyspira pilosicoli]
MIKVSVIVPVYNVENYLRECLDSIINQTLKDIEILCIDDCGTDNSINILKEYAKKDDRIKIISHKENKGLGPARNTGIKESKGEYISFIDSDDYISKDYLENLYNTAKKYDSDIANTLNIKIDRNGRINNSYYVFVKKEYDSIWNLSNIENPYTTNAIAPYAWNKLYKRSFLMEHNLYFMDIKYGSEDADFAIRLMAHKPKISFNNNTIYYYRNRQDSLTGHVLKTNSLSVANSIKHMNNALNYYINNNPELLNDIYLKVFIPASNFYAYTSDNIKEELYNDIREFAKKLIIKDHQINKMNIFEVQAFNQYLALISTNNYYDFLFKLHILNKINNIEKELNHSNNWFRLFGINNTKEYLTIILFGIKISIKKA